MPVHDWTRVDAGIFHSFHLSWISRIMEALNEGVLPATYYALAEQQAGIIGPDVLTLQRHRIGNGPTSVPAEEGGEVVTQTQPAVRFRTSIARTRRSRPLPRHLAIRHVTDDRLVAVVEIVSPGNKSSKNALKAFVRKVIACLDRQIHFLVVDLFPPGPRDPHGIHGAILAEMGAGPFELSDDQPLTLVSYQAVEPPVAYIEPTAVGCPLVSMPLFLTTERYVKVPLEPAYEQAWRGVPQVIREELR